MPHCFFTQDPLNPTTDEDAISIMTTYASTLHFQVSPGTQSASAAGAHHSEVLSKQIWPFENLHNLRAVSKTHATLASIEA